MQHCSEDINRKQVFITGGAKGIGKAIVQKALAQGWDVAFTYYKSNKSYEEILDKAKKEYPLQLCQGYELDLKNFQDVENVCFQVSNDFQNLDAVICNAGMDLPGSLYMMEYESWKQVLDVNLTSNFFILRSFLEDFVAKKYGRIVAIASVAQNGSSGQTAYAVSKAGLTGLIKSIGKEYGQLGITSNIIAPGLIDTSMIGQDLKDLRKFFCEYGPSKRLGKVEEIASAAMFLASKEASYINCAELFVTGGIDWIY